MFRNLLKHSFRALSRQKSYVFINVLGLAIGLVCSIIIVLFIRYELSYDQYNVDKDRMYRVILHGKLGGQEVRVTSTASVIAPTMYNEFPEVEMFLRLNSWGRTIIKYEDKYFTENDFLEADSTFFEFYTLPLLRGNAKTVLNESHYVVISESMAKKIFGEEDPVNKLIQIANDETMYRVTGVMADIPENTHFRASMIGSFMTNPRSSDNEWLSNSFETYVRLKSDNLMESANERFAPMIEKYVGPVILQYFGVTMEQFFEAGNKYGMFLQPLTEIHLDPSIEQDLRAANDPKYLWIFGSIAVLIIIIAAVNFMNLSTAQAVKRAKEVGIKKVCGSTQPRLILQFLTETFILSLFALILAIFITEVSLPYFNDLLNLDLSVGYFENWYTIPVLFLLCIGIGFIAGVYPAFYLSSFNPYKVLKGNLRSGKENGKLRSVLVVIQFVISIILIVGTIIMFRQLEYMQKKKLGFDKEEIFVISNASTIGEKVQPFKDELLNVKGVLSVSASTAIPGRNNNNNGYMLKGRDEESFLLQTSWADKDFLKTYGMILESGRYFDEVSTSEEQGCIVNQAAVKSYFPDDPFAARFMVGEDESDDFTLMPVIGIVEDFHHESLRSPITPYIIRFKEEGMNWGYISIRLAPNTTAETIKTIEEIWGTFTTDSPMQSYFMDKGVERMYREEKQNGQLSILFTIISIFIAALGLYGLTSFAIAQRTKEIGIRKTLGASIGNIWYLFAREIIILVLIATVISVPLIWWVADNWLQNYYYRINVEVTDFVYGFLIAILIALTTISYRTIRSAMANPVDSLRSE